VADCLIGHSGFVGGNLAGQRHFDELFRSSNIRDIRGREFDLLVCSGLPAAKWIANREPDADLANTNSLLDCLRTVRAERVVVISTVDVYPTPRNVDEDSPIDSTAQQPYGRHRRMFEVAMREKFPSTLVVRLPGLFGKALRKNAIFDFLHDNETHKIHCDAVFQFYSLDNLWHDIERALATGQPVINFATGPIRVGDMTRHAFGFEFDNRTDGVPACYDMRTRFDRELGGSSGYLYSRDQVLAQLKDFVAKERKSPT
jgi:nucleoside-diphosphate-sugar epimerase